MDGYSYSERTIDYMSEETIIHRCGWCGCFTDEKGVPFSNYEDFEEYEKMIKDGAKEVLLNGYCCPNGPNVNYNMSPTREMLMDAGML